MKRSEWGDNREVLSLVDCDTQPEGLPAEAGTIVQSVSDVEREYEQLTADQKMQVMQRVYQAVEAAQTAHGAEA